VQRGFGLNWDSGGWRADGEWVSAGLMPLPDLAGAIRDGLASAGVWKLDMIGFDACLMATVEVGYQLYGLADVLVASQRPEPGYGWDYSQALAPLRARPTMGGAEFGQAIARGYYAYASAFDTAAGTSFAPNITLSVSNLWAVPDLMAATDDLAAALTSYLTSRSTFLAIGGVRRDVHEFDDGKGEVIVPNTLVDLGDLAAGLQTEVGGTVGTRASAVLAALAAVVVVPPVCGAAQVRSHGLSVYFPPVRDFEVDGDVYEIYKPAAYGLLDSSVDASWDDFLARYLSFVAGDTTPPSVGTVALVSSDTTHAVFSATVTGDDIGQAWFWVAQVLGTDRAVIATFPTTVSGGRVTEDWHYEVYQISDGVDAVEIPMIYQGSFDDGGSTYDQYAGTATYRAGGGSVFDPISLYYVSDGTDAFFGGAYADSGGGVGPVDLDPTGELHAVWLVVSSGGATSTYEVTDPVISTSSGPPDLLARLADVGTYRVGFSVEDFAGNQASSFIDVDLACQEDYQCLGQPTGEACDAATGTCVECTATNTAACGGATPVCDDAIYWCVPCTVSDATYCDPSTPFCDADVCVECRDILDCFTVYGDYFVCDAANVCNYCDTVNPCPSGWACDAGTGVCY
jgi:hypothetical protein